jgi:thiol-disulfide isomerase/thioredoxin
MNPFVLPFATLVLCLLPAVARADKDTSTSLPVAVADFNRKADEYLAPSGDEQVVPRDHRPAPLTVGEVVQAIQAWSPNEKVDDKTYRIYEQIATTKTLPAGAGLEFMLQWQDGQDGFEYQAWTITLSVMTGPKTGYTHRIRKDKLDRRRALPPASGYFWLVNPHFLSRPLTTSGNYDGVLFTIDQEDSDSLKVTAAWVAQWLGGQRGQLGLRLVAFDEEGKRYVVPHRGVGAHNDLIMMRFALDPNVLPASKVHYLGFEAMDAAGLKKISEAAVRRAREKQIEIISLPEVGHQYDFVLTATDGKKINSKDLRGKVILIDCWATWCGPCMKQLPELKTIYESWHAKGLEIVGLSLDDKPSAAVDACKKLEILWPIVVIPTTDDARELWREAARIETIPRVLLIDRHGVLRFDSSSTTVKFEEKIAALIGDSGTAGEAPKVP